MFWILSLSVSGFVFFFFKQKTAYEMRISDGSSDVCSSDLTMVTDLTAMDIANASMLDESTAAAEAMTLIRRSTKHAANAFFVDAETHPQTIAVVRTRAEPLGIEVVVGHPESDLQPEAVFGVLLQHPGPTGVVRRSEERRVGKGGVRPCRSRW